jgi:uncharacterized protein
MRWHDLLFAHWPVRPEVLRPYLPAPLAIDTFDGWAWLGVVPFRMTGVRPRRVPRLLGLDVNELNVRTYVRGKDRPGVWFFSLDASSPLAVRLARRFYGLPYFRAEISMEEAGDGSRFDCMRRPEAGVPAEFRAEYRPAGPSYRAGDGSLDAFLTERYALFALDRQARVIMAEVQHAPWPLQPAEAEIVRNTTTRPIGLTLPDRQPVLHYARELDVVAWSPVRLRDLGTLEAVQPAERPPMRRAGWRRFKGSPPAPVVDG